MENTFKTLNHFSNPTIFKEEFKKFIVDNGVVGTAAGVSIALVTKDVIQSFVGDIILPSFYFVLAGLHITKVTNMLPGKHFIDLTNFMKQIITWVLVVIITYLFITITFKSLLGNGRDHVKENNPVKERDAVKKEGFF